MLELKNNTQRLTILPETGGAIGQWQVKEHDILHPVSNPILRRQNGVAVGGYPLLPYVNRLAAGRFSFGGEEHYLTPNMEGCPHPIHGNSWEHSWRVVHKTDTHVVLHFDHNPDVLEGAEQEAVKREWPYAYRAALSYELRADGLCVSIVVENRDKVAQPLGLGFHPFFAAAAGARLTFNAEKVWLTDAQGLPVDEAPCEGEWSFSKGQVLDGRVIDNCFAAFGGVAQLEQPGSFPNVTIEADGIFSHLVVFAQMQEGYIAVEPVTSMTDAINRPEIAGRGVHVLQPGQSCGGMMNFRVETARLAGEE